ncbi:4Fe-4S binding protein [Desulfogranum marinum]|uniref:ATP-binding protein n=1 Tax=Desulfogranum marinum TaxID=453220 RepID=UPI0029C62B44|nr:4Fe-4S binding protein [Desulfogranum marinum]
MKNLKQILFDKKMKQEFSIKDGIMTVDESSCDGCGQCIDTCPQSAISMTTLSADDVKNLSFKGRLKVRIKGNQKAMINPDVCTSCGLCIKQCHEFAIHKVERQRQTFSSHCKEELAV